MNPAARHAGPPSAPPSSRQLINSRLTSRWPIFDILPSRAFPPVEFCRGTSPSQAEKSRPRRKPSMGGAKACIAEAQIGPTPGILISLLVLVRAHAELALQFPDLLLEAGDLREQNPAQLANRLGQTRSRIRNGRRQPRDVGDPLGAMTPNSARWPRSALIVCVR